MIIKGKMKIMIVDDSELNREILKEMLSDEYYIEEAENGEQALEIMATSIRDFDLVLLDIVMPGIDGFSVLDYMNRNGWNEFVPVIMISAENSADMIHRAYSRGATDYITRPFDTRVVRQRVINTITLYAKQRQMEALIQKKIEENTRMTNMMTSVLSHIVEFRNGESGLHVLNIKKITECLMNELIASNEKCEFTKADIPIVCNASALHDIGKISIPDEIINKPGRFTDEEFAIMKTHAAIGASMLDDLPFYQDEPLIKAAYDICKCHHERYDGRGYPDGLLGDDIPMTAQIVSIADVYDALTADRCYRKGFSHDKAMEMIFNGECGAFNPKLLDCLKRVEKKIIKVG